MEAFIESVWELLYNGPIEERELLPLAMPYFPELRTATDREAIIRLRQLLVKYRDLPADDSYLFQKCSHGRLGWRLEASYEQELVLAQFGVPMWGSKYLRPEDWGIEG